MVKNLKLRQKVHRNQIQKKKEPSDLDTSETGAEKSELKKERQINNRKPFLRHLMTFLLDFVGGW